MKARRGARSLAAVPALLLCLPAAAQEADAPLELRTQGTFRELFLDMPLSDARAPRGPQMSVRWSGANDWSVPTTLTRAGRTAQVSVDEQADSLAVQLLWPWNGRVSTAVEERMTLHWGGWSDRAVESLHALMGVFDAERTRFPRDRVGIRLAGGVRELRVGQTVLAWGDLVARTQVQLLRTDRLAAALRVDVKAPVGRLAQAGGSQGWDAGVGLAATAQPTPWLTLHAMIFASAWSGLPEGFPLQPARWHGGADFSAVLRRGGWALLVADRVLSAAFESGWTALAPDDEYRRSGAEWALFHAHNQLSFGLRRGAFTAWFAEDVTPGTAYGTPGCYLYLSNMPDIAAGLSWATEL